MATSMMRWACGSVMLVAACGGNGVVGGRDHDAGGDAGGDARDVHDDGGVEPCCDAGNPGAPDAAPVMPDAVTTTVTACATGADFTTISAAIEALPVGGIVEVCAGIYDERLVIADRPIHLRGAGADVTILDAAGGGAAAVVVNGHALTIEGFTVRNGSDRGVRCTDSVLNVRASTFRANVGELGGGIHAIGCTIDIVGTTFDGNDGGESGGAAMLETSTGVIADSTFTSNVAFSKGGALHLVEGAVDVRTSTFTANQVVGRGGALYQDSDSSIEDSTFRDNFAGYSGGAIYTWFHAPVYRRLLIEHNESAYEGGGMYFWLSSAAIEDSTISHNTTFDDGGGIRALTSTLTVSRNIISYNKAVDSDGGGIKVSHAPSVFVDNQFIGNEAKGAGGGVELDNCSSQFRGGVVSGNRASVGGGIHAGLWDRYGGVIEGVEISGNHAHRGAGIYLEDHFRPVTIRGVHIHGNVANYGAGMYLRGTQLTLTNSVIEGNEARVNGGGLMSAPSSDHPWTKECPCPTVDPPVSISFVTVHGNEADAGAAAWIKSSNLTFSSSIFTGHTTTAVLVEPPPPPPPPAEPIDPTVPPAPPPPAFVPPAWRYNDTHPATFSGMADPTGHDGNLATDPGFVAAADFRLGATSACRDRGDPALVDLDGSRADMGAYAGPTPMP